MNTKKIELKYNILRPLFAIAIAYALAFIVLLVASSEPGKAIRIFVLGPLGTPRHFANVIETMIPFIFTGLAISIMRKANQFNLISEGVFFLTGAISAYIAINTNLPKFISPMFIILVCGIIGSIIAMLPAIIKIKWKANELVSSIMMNYVLFFLGMYILNYWMRDISSGYNASYRIPIVSKLPVIISGTRIHAGLIIAILAIVIISTIMYKSKLGYEIKVVGENQNFAKYSGIKVVRVIMLAQIIGGFLAGVGGSVEILGLYNRFQWEALTNYGFDGILVATLAKNNPLVLPISAFFLAYMRIGADLAARSTDIPVEFIAIVQGIVLLLVGAELFLEAMKRKEIVKDTEKHLKIKEAGVINE